MLKTKFKKVVLEFFKKNDFKKKGSFYYYTDEQLIYVVGLQKSSYGKGYYLNLGLFIKELHPNLIYPEYMAGDIRSRFTFVLPSGKETDFIDLDGDYFLSKEKIEKALLNSFKNLIQPAKENGIQYLLNMKPALLLQTTLSAKSHLKIDKKSTIS